MDISLGTSLSSGSVAGQFASQASTNIHVMVVGDSLGAGISEGSVKDEFITAFASHGVTALIEDASQGSKKLITDFWDLNDTTNTGDPRDADQRIGPEYTDEITNNVNKALVTDIVISLDTNDISQVSAGTFTKADMTTAHTYLFNYLFNDPDLSSLLRIHVIPLGRHTTQNSLGFQTGMNDIRQSQIEVVNSLANVFLTSPNYQYDYADNVHPATASNTSWVQALAADVSYRVNKSPKANAGMIITAATVTDLGIDLTIEHGLGTDFTVPATSGDGIEATRIFLGSTELSYTTYERVDATTLRLRSGGTFSGTPKITPVYGSMYDLGVTSVPAVKDNSSYNMPLKPSVPIIATQSSNPFAQLTDVKVGMIPSNDKTFTTDTNFDAIKGIDGSNWSVIGNDMDYDSSAFGGNGGVKFTHANGALRADGDLLTMTTSDTWMYMTVVDYQGDGDVLALGSTAYGPYGGAAFYLEGGALKAYRTGTGQIATIATGLSGTKVSIIINVRSLSECDVYVNSTSVTATIDLMDSHFFGWTTMFISAARNFQSTSNVFGPTCGKNNAHNASNDPSIATLMGYLDDWKNGN